MKLTTYIFSTLVLMGCVGSAALAEKKKSNKEKRFVYLFDGTSTSHWINAKTGKFPDKGWVIDGNCLKHNAKAGGGDIITKNKYEEFDFRFEWKVSKGANSGVKYFIIRDRGSLGHEYQVLDDENHPDGAKGANRQTAAFYDVLEPSKDKPIKQPGKFNSSRILVKGNTVKHFLNGKNVLTYKLGSDEVKAAIAKSKFKNLKVFGQRLAGHILLQDHGDAVWYRNIRIRDLSKN